MTSAVPFDHTKATDRRAPDWVNRNVRRPLNGAFLFFFNPLLDPDTNRLSGTRCMALVFVWLDCYDVMHGHALQELFIKRAVPVDALDMHNIYLAALAVVTWYGKYGMDKVTEWIRAWRGKEG